MGKDERVVVPAGCRLVVGDLPEVKRRDPAYPRNWAGLSGPDRMLLWAWVGSRARSMAALYTDVPCGLVCDFAGMKVSPWVVRQGEAVAPLRIDAVALMDGEWLVIECKPQAGYVAMGQVLTYVFYARRCIVGLEACVPVVVTDGVQEALRPVYEDLGVQVAEVGSVLREAVFGGSSEAGAGESGVGGLMG